MLKIQELLFGDIDNFSPAEIPKYALSVIDLIKKETRTAQLVLQKLILPEMVDLNSKNCQKFREPKKDKRERQAKKLEKLADWHGFKKRDLEQKDEQELEAIRLRKVIDSKKSMGKAEINNKNYTVVGTIMDDPLAGRLNRIKKRDRKERVIDQLLEIDKKSDFTKRKFKDIQAEKMKVGKSQKWKKLKKIQKKKAFRAKAHVK